MQPTCPESVFKNMICRACPNGCHLHVQIPERDHINITGNQCPKGIDQALQFMHPASETAPSPSSPGTAEGTRPVQVTAENLVLHAGENLGSVAAQWGIEIKRRLPGADIEGSPERSLFRTVLEDTAGHRYILEHIPAKSEEIRTRIASTLAFLKQQGLTRVRPYLAGPDKHYILKHRGFLWQMTPFIPGEKLNRQEYIYEQWRGARLADFLIALREKTARLPFFDPAQPFSVKAYVAQLFQNITRHDPALAQSLQPVMTFLSKNFFRIYGTFPTAFCHGDYHPLNMIWDTNDIKAVIDWEFAGYKPEIYDAANLIGCIGMEHPSALLGNLVAEFIRRIRGSRLIQDISWEYLVEFMVAVRFGWLAEWLRKKDTEMIGLETVYMKLLMEEKARLLQAWG